MTWLCAHDVLSKNTNQATKQHCNMRPSEGEASGRAAHCPPLRHTPLGGAHFCQQLEVEVGEGRLLTLLLTLLVRTAP